MKRKKPRHTWREAPGGHTCPKCGMFRAGPNVFYPVGKMPPRKPRGTPPCIKTKAP